MTVAHITCSGGTATPERVRVYQFMLNCVMHMQNAEEVFFQHEQGLLNEEQFHSHRAYLVAFFSSGGVRWYWNMWKSQRPRTQQKFKAWIDDIIREVPTRSLDASVDGYLAQIVAATTNNLK